MSNPFENRQLERYLEEISKPLAEPQRSEWREEVRQHIEALAAAHQELGLSHEDAINAAMASFGEAQTIGKRVEQETVSRSFRPAPALFQGMLRYMLAVVPGFFTLGVLACLYALYGGEEFLANIGRIAAAFSVTTPLFAGWVIGRKASPYHLRRDLLFAPTLGVLASAPMAMIFSVLRHQADWKPDPREILLWLPLALCAASASYILCHKSDQTPVKS